MRARSLSRRRHAARDGLVYVLYVSSFHLTLYLKCIMKANKILQPGERRFSASLRMDGDTAAGETDTPGSTARGKRITRSSIQPKLLFPPSSTHAAVDEDEEAETDIEDQTETKQTEEKEDEAPETPVDAADDVPKHP